MMEDLYRALRLAMDNNDHNSVSIVLFENRGRLDAPYFGRTPSQRALTLGDVGVALLLIQYGVNIHVLDEDGDTLLHLAAERNLTEVGQALIRRGAPIDARGSKNRTPLLIAAKKGHLEMLHLLLSNGAELNATDYRGRSSLYLGALRGHKEVVSVLIAAGANPDLCDDKGILPVAIAYRVRNLDIGDFLVRTGSALPPMPLPRAELECATLKPRQSVLERCLELTELNLMSQRDLDALSTGELVWRMERDRTMNETQGNHTRIKQLEEQAKLITSAINKVRIEIEVLTNKRGYLERHNDQLKGQLDELSRQPDENAASSQPTSGS